MAAEVPTMARSAALVPASVAAKRWAAVGASTPSKAFAWALRLDDREALPMTARIGTCWAAISIIKDGSDSSFAADGKNPLVSACSCWRRWIFALLAPPAAWSMSRVMPAMPVGVGSPPRISRASPSAGRIARSMPPSVRTLPTCPKAPRRSAALWPMVRPMSFPNSPHVRFCGSEGVISSPS